MAHALDGVVDSGIDVIPDQVDRHFSAALEGQLSELDSACLLELNGNDLVFLGRSRAAHFHAVVSTRALFDRRNVFLRSLIGCLRVYPENKLVKRHARDWGQIPPIKRDPSSERRSEKVG